MGRWLTPEQRKGIGKYLKPWGKQPTVATWWIQIITAVVVVVVNGMSWRQARNGRLLKRAQDVLQRSGRRPACPPGRC